MSISRTILSRPRRSQEPAPRRARGRYAVVIATLVGVSACTAVAAEGLPGGDTSGTGTETGSEAAIDTPTPVAPAGPAFLPVATTEVPITTTSEPTSPGSDGAPAGRGTIVAHASSPTVVARQWPSANATPVDDFANPTDRGGPLVFRGIGEPVDGWLEVLLPVRPNGTTGWIDLDDVRLSRNPYEIEVDLASFELTVRRDGEVAISAPVAIGQGGTPTPVGDFYLIELLQPPQANGPYGSYAYGLSGYSDVLDNFNGGQGVIGIHGTNQPELLGGPASHGCIRIHNDTIELMAEFLPLGTPVSILGADR